MNKYLKLLIFIIGLEILGGLSGFITKGSITSWYMTLNKSPLTPPSYVFGIVWSVLYAMIAAAGWLIWQKKSQPTGYIKPVFIIQLLLNLSWTPLFFHFHYVGLSFIWLLCIVLLVGYLIVKLLSIEKWASILLIPYLIWLILACQLNYYIWMYN